ncbi:spore protease YyaC [Bacillus suaedae]|uniref:Spore protease YyaC n=1 Tax=Halalkalibacter suaedae TaxID=2822140 RepID=A0A940WXR8_9BACI|nr:spore protease YyaC [Bacillus suaedae]MBP3952612.1 spore protease YyaC [Bacillus suaedae]
MSTNHRLFGKKDHLRIHMDDSCVTEKLAELLYEMTEYYVRRDLVIICIGTDRSTGDSLGPLIGTKLEQMSLNRFHVYGTLEHPVHAVNMVERLEEIKRTHFRPFILAIDACLGRLTSVGHISLAHGPIQPGAAVQKQLPAIGDIHMTGIVNIGGMMEYFVLQNTRLHTVMTMADIIAESIKKADLNLPMKETSAPTLLQKLKVKPQLLFQSKKETPL